MLGEVARRRQGGHLCTDARWQKDARPQWCGGGHGAGRTSKSYIRLAERHRRMRCSERGRFCVSYNLQAAAMTAVAAATFFPLSTSVPAKNLKPGYPRRVRTDMIAFNRQRLDGGRSGLGHRHSRHDVRGGRVARGAPVASSHPGCTCDSSRTAMAPVQGQACPPGCVARPRTRASQRTAPPAACSWPHCCQSVLRQHRPQTIPRRKRRRGTPICLLARAPASAVPASVATVCTFPTHEN